ncbi:hypothetical protein [Streptomyces sp. NPDC002889]|uniref:hypothetical protein n=1 Tax=Streptomyces sp. NPDC002889 TaxID=3364669 RepID=UPI0036B2012D
MRDEAVQVQQAGKARRLVGDLVLEFVELVLAQQLGADRPAMESLTRLPLIAGPRGHPGAFKAPSKPRAFTNPALVVRV